MLPGKRWAVLHPCFVAGSESCLSSSVSLCLCGYFCRVQLCRRLLTVFEMNSRSRYLFTTLATYLSVIAAVFAFNAIRLRVLSRAQASGLSPKRNVSEKPFFSLSTNRTFAPGEHARLSASYQGIDHLDFRVYQIKDPAKFFRQLDDPHQLGEKKKEEVSGTAGVYLIETVNGDLRTYSIAVVSNLTMVQKTTKDGQVVVYVVDRKSGAPHEGVSVEVTKGKDSLTTGTTDKSGLFAAEIKTP